MPGGEPLFFYTDLYYEADKRTITENRSTETNNDGLSTIERCERTYCVNIQTLIKNGHTLNDISNYSLTRFKAFCYIVKYINDSDIHLNILRDRQAQYGDENSINTFMDILKNG